MNNEKKSSRWMVRLITGVLILLILTSCTNGEKVKNEVLPNNTDLLQGTSFENLELPDHYDIRQFEGVTLNFIVENNLYANILTHESEEFSEVTGININIRPVDFDTLIQKVNIDFIAQDGKYQLIYVDPYQTLNRFYNYLEVLNPYNQYKNKPQIVGFTDAFIDFQTMVCSNFIDQSNVYAIPFDSTTMILYYRKDIFDKYREQMIDELGYDPIPGEKDFTWERYCEVAQWIDENVPDEEVKYGSGLMAQEHNSIFCEFSNILAAFGGDYFLDENINSLGLKNLDKINTLDENFIQALDTYKKVAAASAPESVNWNWTDTANAFRNGEIAMMANWDENYTYVEDALLSDVAGKVGYSILPFGDERSGNIYGGSGIGINKYATDIEKQAAWLYIFWATSEDMQMKVLFHPEGGSLPTRKSAYNQIENSLSTNVSGENSIEEDILLKHVSAVLDAWEPQNIYLRPKTSDFYEFEKILIANLHQMILDKTESEEISQKIYDEFQQLKVSGKIQ